MKLKGWVISICVLLIIGTLCTTYVFDKLGRYKREMARLYNYHTAVQHRQQEDIDILCRYIKEA